MQTLLPLCCKSPRLCTRALAHDSSLCLVASQLYYQQCHDASAWPYSCENSAYAMVSPELNAFPAHVLACTVCVLFDNTRCLAPGVSLDWSIRTTLQASELGGLNKPDTHVCF